MLRLSNGVKFSPLAGAAWASFFVQTFRFRF